MIQDAVENMIEINNIRLYPSRPKLIIQDDKHIQLIMVRIPMYIIEATLKSVFRLTKNNIRLPLRTHFKSNFSQLNRNRLHKRYSAGTMFSSIPSLCKNYTYAQIFYGHQRHFSNIIGMIKE